jgi:hypothetical protein
VGQLNAWTRRRDWIDRPGAHVRQPLNQQGQTIMNRSRRPLFPSLAAVATAALVLGVGVPAWHSPPFRPPSWARLAGRRMQLHGVT